MAQFLLTRATINPVWSGFRLSFHGDPRARYNLTEPIPLQVEHLAGEWNPSDHLALVFELWRYPPSDVVLTAAVSPITGTRGMQERLIPSRFVLYATDDVHTS